MELKPGYKHTEAGIIPDDWDAIRVGALATFSSGSGIKVGALHANSADTPIPVFGGNGVAGYTERPLINEPTVVVGRVGQKCGEVYVSSGPAWVTDNALYPRKKHRRFDTRFLALALVSASLNDVRNRNDLPLVTQRILESVHLAWPPDIEEQRAISGVASDLDALLNGLDRLINKKCDLKHAAMQQLLSGVARLPGFSDHFHRVEFGTVVSIRNSKAVGASAMVGKPCVELDSIGQGDGRLNKTVEADGKSVKYSFRAGDVLFGRLRAYLKKFWLATFDGVCSTEIWPLIPRDEGLRADFLHLLVQTQGFLGAASISYGTHMPRSDWSVISKLEILLPSAPEQEAIAAVLSDMDAEIAALEAHRDKTRMLKQAMMQELLTGRTRLVSVAQEGQEKKQRHRSHNWEFNEAVVISVLIRHFGSEQFPMGRKRYTKLAYLLHRHAEGVATGYRKKAAGPYNPDVRYKGPERIAQKNGYIQPHANGKFSGFVAAENIAKAEAYFEQWYGRDLIIWIEQFRRRKNDELELLATVGMAAEDLRRAGQPVAVEAIRTVIRSHPEWVSKLDRAVFSDLNIARALNEVNRLFPTTSTP